MLKFIQQANVLIDNMGQACLADFGLSRILEELSGTASTTSNLAGSIRWMAPELVISSCRPNIYTDMYAFGSLMLEVCCTNVARTRTLIKSYFISGQVIAQCIPYHNIRGDAQVVMAISRGETPERPDNLEFRDNYWLFVQGCWSGSPQQRPTAASTWRTLQSFMQEVRSAAVNTGMMPDYIWISISCSNGSVLVAPGAQKYSYVLRRCGIGPPRRV